MIHLDPFSERLSDSIKEEITLCPNYTSQASLAQGVEMARETLCRKVNDPRKISVYELASIAAALGKRLHIYFE